MNESNKSIILRKFLNTIYVILCIYSILQIKNKRYYSGVTICVICIFLFLISIGSVRRFVLKHSKIRSFIREKVRIHDRWLMNKINDNLPKAPVRILNYGCGLNTLSDLLVKRGHTVVPIDISDMSIGKSRVITYDGKTIPEDLGNFDIGLICAVLHHIESEYINKIIEHLMTRCKKIIILEDVVLENTFLKTSLKCMIENVMFFNHPLQFKTHEQWIELFSKYGTLTSSNTDDRFSVYELVSNSEINV